MACIILTCSSSVWIVFSSVCFLCLWGFCCLNLSLVVTLCGVWPQCCWCLFVCDTSFPQLMEGGLREAYAALLDSFGRGFCADLLLPLSQFYLPFLCPCPCFAPFWIHSQHFLLSVRPWLGAVALEHLFSSSWRGGLSSPLGCASWLCGVARPLLVAAAGEKWVCCAFQWVPQAVGGSPFPRAHASFSDWCRGSDCWGLVTAFYLPVPWSWQDSNDVYEFGFCYLFCFYISFRENYNFVQKSE